MSEIDDLQEKIGILEQELAFMMIILETQQETSLDGIVVVNENDYIISSNKIFAALWNIKPEDLKLTFTEIFDKIILKKVAVQEQLKAYADYVLQNSQKTNKVEAVLISGKILECHCAPMIGNDGRSYGKVWYFRDITEQKRVEMELANLATIDGLTDVFNRKFGLIYINRQIQTSKRDKSYFSICYIDVNNFKTINDKFGHSEGDEVLKFIGRTFKSVLREVDIICRLGGDEFLLCFPNCNLEQARMVWSRVEEKIASYNNSSGKEFKVSLSKGFAVFGEDKNKTLDQLIADADSEMYKDKIKSKKEPGK